MDDVAGDLVLDASGHGHDAACSSVAATCPVVVAGKHGNGLRFDGVNALNVIGDEVAATFAGILDEVRSTTVPSPVPKSLCSRSRSR